MIQQYQLNDEQLRYTGTPEMPIKISLKNPFIHPIIGIANDRLTNFFVLDEKRMLLYIQAMSRHFYLEPSPRIKDTKNKAMRKKRSSYYRNLFIYIFQMRMKLFLQ